MFIQKNIKLCKFKGKLPPPKRYALAAAKLRVAHSIDAGTHFLFILYRARFKACAPRANCNLKFLSICNIIKTVI
jgi:hypothetical protein